MTDKLFALFLGNILSALFILIKSHYSFGKVIYSAKKLEKPLIKELLKFSRPLILLGIVGILFSASDRILIQHITGSTTEVGYLGMSQRLGSILSLALIGILNVWGINALEVKDNNSFAKMINDRILGLFIILFLSIVVIIASKTILIKYIFTESYKSSFYIAIIYIIAFFWIKIRETFEYHFLRTGNSKLITGIFCFTTSFYLVTSILFIKNLGALGAVLTSLITSVIHSLILFYLNLKEKINVKRAYMYVGLVLSIISVISIFLFVY